MPYMEASILRANEFFSAVDGFDPEGLMAAIGDAGTLLEGAENLGLFDVIGSQYGNVLRDFFTLMPPSLDAAILAGLRSALGRGVRVQFMWQPGYDFEMRAWEISEGTDGALHFHILSPHPREPELD